MCVVIVFFFFTTRTDGYTDFMEISLLKIPIYVYNIYNNEQHNLLVIIEYR